MYNWNDLLYCSVVTLVCHGMGWCDGKILRAMKEAGVKSDWTGVNVVPVIWTHI